MRILALPAALALAFCLYLPLPQSAQLISHTLLRLYHLALRPFSRRAGRADAAPALAAMLLVLGGAVTLLGALHPAVCAVVMAPLFPALSLLPPCAAVKEELDSGKYAGDIPEYESRVRTACAATRSLRMICARRISGASAAQIPICARAAAISRPDR